MSALPSPFFWRRSEEVLLRREYPRGGSKRVAALLPHRSPSAIKMRAATLGVRSEVHWTAAELEQLRAAYPLLGLRRTVEIIPDRSYEAVKRKVHDLGLRRCRATQRTAAG